MTALWYVLVPSQFGTLVVFWRETTQGPKVARVLLPTKGILTTELLQSSVAHAAPRTGPEIQDLAKRMTSYMAGNAHEFSLEMLEMDACSGFQRQVLKAEHGIPRGWVSTYGRIARHLGQAGSARAVGNALANNPFPILIPCHRAIRSDGTLGGYQGGTELKRALLEREGIQISTAGKVLTDKVYY